MFGALTLRHNCPGNVFKCEIQQGFAHSCSTTRHGSHAEAGFYSRRIGFLCGSAWVRHLASGTSKTLKNTWSDCFLDESFKNWFYQPSVGKHNHVHTCIYIIWHSRLANVVQQSCRQIPSRHSQTWSCNEVGPASKSEVEKPIRNHVAFVMWEMPIFL